jgi:plastocyanin
MRTHRTVDLRRFIAQFLMTPLGLALTLAAAILLLLLVNGSRDHVRAAEPAALGTFQLEVSATGPEVPADSNGWLTDTLRIRLRYVGGDAPAATQLQFALPEGTRMAARPRFIPGTLGTFTPQLLQMERQSVTWQGQVQPDGEVVIGVPVRLAPCYGTERTVEYVVTARQTDDSPLTAATSVTLPCADLSIADIALEQTVLTEHTTEDGMTELAMTEQPVLLPGEHAAIRTTVQNNGSAPARISLNFAEIGIRPPLTATLQADNIPGVSLEPGERRSFERPILQMDIDITDEVTLDPRDLFLVSAVNYCLSGTPGSACPDPEVSPTSSAWDVLEIPVRPNDLGDAPDSSNHAGVAMRAYPAVQANFPTVFDPATGIPPGPLHRHPRPFHLGPRVSLEAEADIGPDQDPTNNIIPAADQPNRDRRDDGINPAQLGFAHCQPGSLNVDVFIDPAAQARLLEQGLKEGYLNIWVDGRRDGDWDDALACPPVAGQPSTALEHIVIDHPVDIAGLFAGVNTIAVPTGPVPWPAELVEQPAWLRVTLSERPSNKTLVAGGIPYGDGRGYDEPFALGETEDYLINRDTDGADVTVYKTGRAIFDTNPEDGTTRRRLVWKITYRNQGSVAAENVRLRDTYADGLNINALLKGVTSRPEVNATADGNSLLFNLGRLAPGAEGRIVVVTEVPAEVEITRNVVEILAGNDINPNNNQAEATVQPGLRAPLILEPGSGTSSNPNVTLKGRAHPGAQVGVYVEETSITSTTANDAGQWEAEISLAPGPNTIYAVAELGNRTSPPSDRLLITLDRTLPYNPISLSFTDADGQRIHPNNPHVPGGSAEQTDAPGRQLPVERGGMLTDTLTLGLRLPITATLQVNCTLPNPSFMVEIAGVNAGNLTDDDNDGSFSGLIEVPDNVTETTDLALVSRCGEVEHTSRGQFLLPWGGLITDATSGQPLADAEISLLRLVATSSMVNNRSDRSSSPWALDANDSYQQTTGAAGRYGFFPPPGLYQIEVRRVGYQPYRSPALLSSGGPPAPDIALLPAVAGNPDYVVGIDESGFQERVLVIPPDTIVEWVNLDTDAHTVTGSGTGGLQLQANGSTDSGLLPAGDSYRLQLTDVGSYSFSDGRDSGNTMTIIVDANAQAADSRTLYLPLIQR